MAKRFNPEQTLQLVTLYKAHECLWNIYSDKYKNPHLKRNALLQMCADLNIPGFTPGDLKIKIKTIRSTYCIELDKIEKSMDTDNVYKPRVIWFDELNSFIREVTMKKRRVTEENESQEASIDQISEGEQEEIEDSEVITEDMTVKYEEDPLGKYTYRIILDDNYEVKSEPKKRKIYQLDSTNNTVMLVQDGEDDLEPILKIPASQKLTRIAPKPIVEPKIRQPTKTAERAISRDHTYHAGVNTPPRDGAVISKDEEDEFDTFGKHVANQLRKLSTLKYILAQEEIQCTITKFRMDDMSE